MPQTLLQDPKCTRCELSSLTSGNICVWGRGPVTASLMLIGEAPGNAEAFHGKPFMGAAGQLLNRILERLELDPYITNVVKCRPPKNNTPTPVHLTACSPFLLRELEDVAPQVIMCLGRTAATALGVTEIPRGEFMQKSTTMQRVGWTWHPAYALRGGKDGKRSIAAVISEHLQTAKRYLT